MKELFVERLYECQRHAKTIQRAKNHLIDTFPLDVKAYKQMDDVGLSFVDQMVYRFSKLQDTMGEKIFPSVLMLLGENVKNKSFIDRLNRLEEIEMIEMQTWMRLRKIRNEISPEYSFNLEEVVDTLNDIYNTSDILLSIYRDFYTFCRERFEFVKDNPLMDE